jgi:hypothetical protein
MMPGNDGRERGYHVDRFVDYEEENRGLLELLRETL